MRMNVDYANLTLPPAPPPASSSAPAINYTKKKTILKQIIDLLKANAPDGLTAVEIKSIMTS